MSNGISGLLSYRVDLDKPAVMTPLREPLVTEDKMAYSIQLTAVSKGQPVSLAGCGAVGYMIRADGATVTTDTVQGTADGVTLWLPEACYTVPGRYSLVVKLTDSQTRRTVLWLEGNVARSRTDAIVDPENVVPSLDALLQQIAVMEAGTEAAASAASKAGAAATAATAAAEQASSKATAAGNAATAANAAATAINSMTAQASPLPAGSEPTAAVTEAEDGHKVISLGIPKGDTGKTPALSIGTVTTGEPGTQASASITGTAEAPVLDLTIPRGQTGSVEHMPLENNPAQPLGTAAPGVLDTVARGDHVHAMPYAADIPLSAADATTVQTALARRDRAANLLDNSDFRRPVNQRGQSSYSGNQYTIDRWRAYSSSTHIIVGSGFVTIESSALMQYLDADPAKVYTAAVRRADGGVVVASGTFADGFGNAALGIRCGIANDMCRFMMEAVLGRVVWAALYEGFYTADALPAYVPKGFAAELLECQRYYLRLSQGAGQPLAFGGTYGTGNGRMKTPTPCTMRLAPTITAGKGVGNLRVICNGTQYAATAIGGVQAKADGVLYQVTADGLPSAHAATLMFATEDVLELNAEL